MCVGAHSIPQPRTPHHHPASSSSLPTGLLNTQCENGNNPRWQTSYLLLLLYLSHSFTVSLLLPPTSPPHCPSVRHFNPCVPLCASLTHRTPCKHRAKRKELVRKRGETESMEQRRAACWLTWRPSLSLSLPLWRSFGIKVWNITVSTSLCHLLFEQ